MISSEVLPSLMSHVNFHISSTTVIQPRSSLRPVSVCAGQRHLDGDAYYEMELASLSLSARTFSHLGFVANAKSNKKKKKILQHIAVSGAYKKAFY